MLFIFCTMSRIVYVCGSRANANWTSSRFAIHMFAQRALPIRALWSKGAQLLPLALARAPSRMVGSCQTSFHAPQCCERSQKGCHAPAITLVAQFSSGTGCEALIEETMLYSLHRREGDAG